MSVDATRFVWSLAKKLISPTEKLILLAIADRCGERGECWPSISRIIKDTGYTRDTVFRARSSLIKKNILRLTGEYKGRTKQIPVMQLMCDSWREGKYIDDESWETKGTTERPLEKTIKGTTERRVPVLEKDPEPKRIEPKISNSTHLAPPPEIQSFKTWAKRNGVPSLRTVTERTLETLKAAKETLEKEGFCFDDYLHYLENMCSSFLEPYMSNGKERQHNFYSLMRPSNIHKAAIEGKFANRT
jgi:hypothetical protein